MEAWVFPQELTATRTVVGKYETSTGCLSYAVRLDAAGVPAGAVSSDGTPATTVTCSGTAPLTNGEWHHVAFQREGPRLVLIVDGARAGAAEFTGSVYDGEGDLEVGALGGLDMFTGTVDEVRLSSVARYHATTPDASGNDNHGALHGGADITDQGRFEKALALDGVDAYVDIADDAALELGGDFTIEAWVFPEALTGTCNVLTKRAAGELSYRLYLEDGIPKAGLSTDGAAEYPLVGTEGVPVPVHEWTHLALTLSGSAVELLVDGAVVNTETVAGPLHDNDIALVIGADAEGAGLFRGKIDEVRISSVDRGDSLGTVVTDYTYNARNQLVTETSGASEKIYCYDPNGNVRFITETVGGVEASVEEMTYDELNRMLTHSGPKGTETFTYRGAEWHRASANGTQFLYDGDNVLADIGAGGVEALYVTPFLDQNLSITKGGSTYYYSQDGLGSVRTLTDASGVVKNRYDYLAFGGAFAPATAVSVAQRYTYTGRELNSASDLMYYRYRQYDPRVGRFGGRDPIGELGGIVLYCYVDGQAVLWPDPLGLDGTSISSNPNGRPAGVLGNPTGKVPGSDRYFPGRQSRPTVGTLEKLGYECVFRGHWRSEDSQRILEEQSAPWVIKYDQRVSLGHIYFEIRHYTLRERYLVYSRWVHVGGSFKCCKCVAEYGLEWMNCYQVSMYYNSHREYAGKEFETLSLKYSSDRFALPYPTASGYDPVHNPDQDPSYVGTTPGGEGTGQGGVAVNPFGGGTIRPVPAGSR